MKEFHRGSDETQGESRPRRVLHRKSPSCFHHSRNVNISNLDLKTFPLLASTILSIHIEVSTFVTTKSVSVLFPLCSQRTQQELGQSPRTLLFRLQRLLCHHRRRRQDLSLLPRLSLFWQESAGFFARLRASCREKPIWLCIQR